MAKAGRPTRYKKEYNEQARKLCLLGATDRELADFFCVSEQTVNTWKKNHPEFLESIRAGKEIADIEVSSSLFSSTQDRMIPSQQAFKCKVVEYNEQGKRVEREVIEVVDIMQAVPADFRSQQFWLKNRRSRDWRDKIETEHSGEIKATVINLGSGVRPEGEKDEAAD